MSAFKTISRGSREINVLKIKFTIALEIVFLDRPNYHKEESAEEGRLMTS